MKDDLPGFRSASPSGSATSVRAWKAAHFGRGVVLGLALTLALGGLSAPAAASGDREELNAATFERAWSLIDQRYWDPDFGGLDWNGVREELLPRARAAENDAELRAVLGEMIERLGQSHFGIIPGGAGDDSDAAESERSDADSGDSAADGDGIGFDGESCSSQLMARLQGLLSDSAGDAELGFEVREVDAGADGDASDGFPDVAVTRVYRGTSADEAGVEPGWLLRRIDGIPVTAVRGCLGTDLDEKSKNYLVFQAIARSLSGSEGDTVDLVFHDAENERRDLRLDARAGNGVETTGIGNLQGIRVRYEADWRQAGDAKIALIRFDGWMLPASRRFEESMVEMAGADGMVIDLRGNPGGIAGLSMGIAGYFIDEKLSLGTMKTRGEELEFRVNPRGATMSGEKLETFRGPVAILIDSFSASTSEIFAAGMQDLGRARVFGQTSMAAALPAMVEELPNGDFLMHAIADWVRSDGRRVEGDGVVPDEVVPLRREDLLEGRDAAAEAALRWIASATDEAISDSADGDVR